MATQEQSLSRTRESQVEEEIKVLEEAKSDLEAEVERLEKQIKQLEIFSSEQLTEVHFHMTYSNLNSSRLYILVLGRMLK